VAVVQAGMKKERIDPFCVSDAFSLSWNRP